MTRKKAKGVSPISSDRILEILRPLLQTHSPTGHEDEARDWVGAWLSERCKDVRVDETGSVVARIPGGGKAPAVCLIAHLDEIGMIVKRIDPDGKIRVARVGGSYPWKYGEGPVDLLTAGGPIPGFLSFGSLHASEESAEIYAARSSKNLTWEMTWVDCKLSTADLADAGVHPGIKGVVSRSRKIVTEIGDYIGSFALDDKALVAVLLALTEQLLANPPPRDVYLIASVGEEIGSGRAAYTAGNLPVESAVAVEVAPVLPEYGLSAGPDPVVLYKDEYNIYDESVCRELEMAVSQAGCSPQRAVLSSFGSDVSLGSRGGRLARYGCIAIACENTHGYEVIAREGLSSLASSLEKWVRR